jgi:hypothetical protein
VAQKKGAGYSGDSWPFLNATRCIQRKYSRHTYSASTHVFRFQKGSSRNQKWQSPSDGKCKCTLRATQEAKKKKMIAAIFGEIAAAEDGRMQYQTKVRQHCDTGRHASSTHRVSIRSDSSIDSCTITSLNRYQAKHRERGGVGGRWGGWGVPWSVVDFHTRLQEPPPVPSQKRERMVVVATASEILEALPELTCRCSDPALQQNEPLAVGARTAADNASGLDIALECAAADVTNLDR